ncbi:XisI protein [Oscillatoria sp. CS-180]|uniref:XisI protein n=1 Tax=Oscillatoria sp. CS-180 TaxID=3021720 RepID=UPI002330E66E|nr:XisI protein [Oscillatoria sp. CS-180]MDB9529024.1 XisI protein [Oscillatoria sp. CS-180]
MDKLEKYRRIIQEVLVAYQKWASKADQSRVKQCVSFDENHDHYFWFHIGWNDKRRDFGVTVYLRIENDKIWVEEDWTQHGVANDLLNAGIPAEDIVLGFQHPSKRPLTNFAMA